MKKLVAAVLYAKLDDSFNFDIFEFGDDIFDFENYEISESPQIDLSPFIKQDKLEEIFDEIPKANFNEVIEDEEKKFKFEQFVKKVYDQSDYLYFLDPETNEMEEIDYDDFLEKNEKYDSKLVMAIYEMKEIDDEEVYDEDEYFDDDDEDEFDDYDEFDEEDDYEEEEYDEDFDDEDDDY